MKTYQDLCNVVANRKYNLFDIRTWCWLEPMNDNESSPMIYHWGMTTGDGRVSVREIVKFRSIEVYLPRLSMKIVMESDNAGYIEGGSIYRFKSPILMDDLYKSPTDQELEVFKEFITCDEEIPDGMLEELKSLEK